MKSFFAFSLGLFVLLSACKKDEKVDPTEYWSDGCKELAPDGANYRMNGACCQYLLFPAVKLEGGKTISVDGQHFAFTGAGYSELPVKVQIKKAADGKTLKIDYVVNNNPISYELIPGKAKTLCDCGCD